jgi:hypothetical protein
MINIREYILLPKCDRQKHLVLTDPCINGLCENEGSLHHINRGRLSLFLGTSVPAGHGIQLCHACNNGRCSNPRHHYWGTPKENHQDQVANGTYKSLHQRTVEKYGEAEYLAMMKIAGGKRKIKDTL